MSLRLRQAVPGRPSRRSAQNVFALVRNDEAYILYTSSSNVVLLDSRLDLRETLLFWSALPHRASSSTLPDVQGVLGDEKDGLIIAWSGKQIVLWYLLQAKGRVTWTVHSTLVVSEQITSVDYKKGNLIAATTGGIEGWKTDPTADVVVWDRLWDRPYGNAHRITFSPSLQHVAWFNARSALVLSIDRKGKPAAIPQEIRHPRPLTWIGWRTSTSASADDYLYTITENQILRIHSPVLDDPTWFQLLSSLDSTAFTSRPPHSVNSKAKAPATAAPAKGVLIPLDSDTMRLVVAAEKGHTGSKGRQAEDLHKKLQSLEGEEADLVLWVGQDGSVALRSIVNIDRKPPTLLKSLPLAHVTLPAPHLQPTHWSCDAQILHDPSTSHLLAVLPTTADRRSLSAYRLPLSDLLTSSNMAIVPVTPNTSEEETAQVELEHNIDHFVRTPNGRGLLAMTESGEVGVWYKERLGKIARDGPAPRAIIGKGQWTEASRPRSSAIFAKGRAIVFYTVDEVGIGKISLQHLDQDASSPTPAVTLPDFELDLGDDIAMLLAVSDIDDGFAGRGRRTQRAIIMAASRQGHAWVWRVDSRLLSTVSEDINVDDPPVITSVSHYTLPIEGGEPHLILPVDPMGWHQSVIDWKNMTPLQDMILTVSKSGVLEFWSPELGHHFKDEIAHCERKGARRHGSSHPAEGDAPWRRTGTVRTGRKDALNARCSSRKKTVLICRNEKGEQEMTIWDSNVSEFSTGLELTHVFESEQTIQDLDWTTTSDLQSVLAVGFPHQVVLVCEQRLSYTEATPGWAPFLTLNLEQHTSVPIADSIWLAGGSLAIGAGNQIYLFSRFLDKTSQIATPRGSVKSLALDAAHAEDIFQLIAWQNGPLFDFHPTVLAQSLLWNKINLVKGIIVDLAKSLRLAEEEDLKRIDVQRRDPSDFWQAFGITQTQVRAAPRGHEGLFDKGPAKPEEEDEEDFPPRMVDDLVQRLQGNTALPLSPGEKSQLASVARAVLEAERQRRSLDKCGLRYLISIRMAVNNSTRGPEGNGSTSEALRISFRNFVWATHSESQDLLLSAATECCENGKMMWEDAKRLGVFLWLKSSETLRSHLENVARNRFMADDDRDPTKCSLVFFALGKKKVVHGLWKQAPGHKEQGLMLKFLSNDFELERWKTAAVKNAYALLSKQRYEFAAAMFMLGGCPKDAITVCLRQMNDWQLGYALARAVEGGTDGPIVKWILTDTVVPLAMAGGHRWLATWAFWNLGRRDLAVRVLISPMDDVASAWKSDKPLPVGNPENDDPSLLLLFQHLKSKSLQTAKGTSEIPEKTEFDFVLHNARVFFRMGCHSLGLDLLRSWSFERPFFPSTKVKSKTATPSVNGSHTPLNGSINVDGARPRRPSLSGPPSFMRPAPRRPSFMLSGHARRESMVMDMDVFAEGTSEAPTRVPSPQAAEVLDEKQEDANSVVREDRADDLERKDRQKEEEVKEEPPRKMGNLMKELKQDVQQGAMEFDMSSFF